MDIERVVGTELKNVLASLDDKSISELNALMLQLNGLDVQISRARFAVNDAILDKEEQAVEYQK